MLSVVVLVISLFVGAVVALVALGFVAVGWAVFAFRTWQLKRQVSRDRPDAGSTTIEGDYRVVDDSREDRD